MKREKSLERKWLWLNNQLTGVYQTAVKGNCSFIAYAAFRRVILGELTIIKKTNNPRLDYCTVICILLYSSYVIFYIYSNFCVEQNIVVFFLLKVRGHQLYFCFKENEIKITFLCQTLLLDVYFDIQSRAQIRLFGGPDLVREPPVDYLCTNPAVKFIPVSFILIIWTQ